MTAATATEFRLTAVTILIQDDPNTEPRPFAMAGEPITPGLAITPLVVIPGAYQGSWVVTHTSSGLRIPGAEACIACVRRAATHLADAAVDWTRDRDALVADPTAIDAARRYGGATCECEGESCQ
jgi:hypothetical protein